MGGAAQFPDLFRCFSLLPSESFDKESNRVSDAELFGEANWGCGLEFMSMVWVGPP